MKNKFFLFGIISFLAIGCTEEEKNIITDISSIPSVMCAPVTSDKEWYGSDNVAPLFEGLDVLDFPISTQNKISSEIFQSRADFSLWI